VADTEFAIAAPTASTTRGLDFEMLRPPLTAANKL